ncbi:g10622 [Coccomyxa elongata]
MAQTLLSPIHSALTFQHVQQRPLKVQGGGSALGRVRNDKCRSPWQTMLDTSGGSNPMELSTSGRELPLFHLHSLSFETEQDKRMQQQREFYLNYGRALRVLRENIPRFFKQAPDTSIFTEDVVFVDHIGPRIGMIFSSVVGRKAYSQHIWLLRFHASLIFSRCEVEVQRIWERDSRTVAVRWKLRCFPRLLDRSLVNLDGISEYKFNDRGLIYQHTVDIINWDDSRKKKPERQLYRSLSTAGC